MKWRDEICTLNSKVGSPDPVRIERVADVPLSVVSVVSMQ